ncbi:hypothetical protein KR546_11770 [Nitriliruptoria bacterium AS10]|nr:hypothetical protein [Salsipaludibacter albus]
MIAQQFDPDVEAPPGLQGTADTFLGWMMWVGLGAGIAGLIVIGIMMAAGRRNRSSMAADGAAGIPWVLGGLTLISFSVGLAGAVLA